MKVSRTGDSCRTGYLVHTAFFLLAIFPCHSTGGAIEPESISHSSISMEKLDRVDDSMVPGTVYHPDVNNLMYARTRM